MGYLSNKVTVTNLILRISSRDGGAGQRVRGPGQLKTKKKNHLLTIAALHQLYLFIYNYTYVAK